jgi:hypothetical protein
MRKEYDAGRKAWLQEEEARERAMEKEKERKGKEGEEVTWKAYDYRGVRRPKPLDGKLR